MKNRILLSLSLAVVCIAVLPGCKALDPGASAAVVRTEQVQDIAFEAMNTFLKIEHSQREMVKQKWPEVHQFAEYLRTDVVVGGKKMSRGISYFHSLNEVKLAYKMNRTEEGRIQLISTLAAVEKLLAEVNQHLATIYAPSVVAVNN